MSYLRIPTSYLPEHERDTHGREANERRKKQRGDRTTYLLVVEYSNMFNNDKKVTVCSWDKARNVLNLKARVLFQI